MSWYYNPHTGGKKIPTEAQGRMEKRIENHAAKYYAGKYTRLDIKFKGQFCYIDAYIEPFAPKKFNEELFGETREEHTERLRNTPTHLCRLRYFGDENSCSVAFYAYSSETYKPAAFSNGTFEGTLEEAFDVGAVYLQ